MSTVEEIKSAISGLFKGYYIRLRKWFSEKGWEQWDNGPILSRTLDFMQEYRKPNNGWDKWVSPKENHKVSLARKYKSEDLDLLSVSIIKILKDLWKKHASRDEWDMVDYTHRYCKEY